VVMYNASSAMITPVPQGLASLPYPIHDDSGRRRAENRSTRKVDNVLAHVALRLTIAEIGMIWPRP
jgi:hypothetical protein